METEINLSNESAESVVNEKTARVPWVDKHAELIAKLEAEYNLPIDEQSNLSGTPYHQFSIGDLNILASEQYSPEILEDNIVYPMLLTPDWVLGACNIRGKIIPVFDLENLLYPDVCNTKPTNYKTFILHDGQNAIGLPLFNLPTLIHLKDEECIRKHTKLPAMLKPYIKKIYKRKKKIWVLVDFTSFFISLKNNIVYT